MSRLFCDEGSFAAHDRTWRFAVYEKFAVKGFAAQKGT
jgi:hypothetical protein